MHAINVIQELSSHAQIAIPTLVRLTLPFVREIIGHAIHKLTHHSVGHSLAHRSHLVHKVLGKAPWLLDALIIGVMLGYGAVTEGHEAGHEASSDDHAAE
jgi:hypothetical protein